MSKLRDPDFLNIFNDYDILFFQETKIDEFDHLALPSEFSYVGKYRKTYTRKSGGLITIFRNNLKHLLEFPDTQSNFVQWVKVDRSVLKTDRNMLLGCIYIPPENTKYTSLDAFNEIESEMFQLCEQGDPIGLLGDFNAKTGTLQDYVETDKSLLDIFDMLDDVDLINFMYDYENIVKAGASLIRKSTCTARTNTYGHMLLDMCRKNNIYIVNGRLGKDKHAGECTCQDVSVIDYFLASSKLFFHILDFEVKDFSPQFSDVHKQLHISFKNYRTGSKQIDIENDKPKSSQAKNWKCEKSEEYVNNFLSDDRLQNIISEVDELFARHEIGDVPSQVDINNIIDTIGMVFDDNAKNVFGIKSAHSDKTRETDGSPAKTPWFDNDCKKRRKAFHAARKTYSLNKTVDNRNNMNLASREYKNVLNKAYSSFRSKLSADIREASKNNPKKFWEILKRCTNASKSDVKVPLDELYDYFKNINSSEDEVDNDLDPDNDEFRERDLADRILNCPIDASEIEKVIKNLPNNKAMGIDCIRNEYLKSTLHILLPTCVKIFNVIFDTGIVPESWTLGMIQPIYKNKGDVQDPSNYRPISLLSCFSKVFTSILNNRLTSFADEINLISPVQAGFRRNHSTLDNIFILNSFIELYFLHKKKLFCTFVDFSKAFDKVSRSGLWTKMLRSGINGKCFSVIKNMYQNVKSCVRKDGECSDFFNCSIGVRQGENLSPFLFSIFLNDLESFFDNHDVSSLQTIDDLLAQHIDEFMKMFLLLYADDTLLFSETYDGMQKVLNVFNEYCKLWKLEVNQSKTKVVIFSKRKFRPAAPLLFDGHDLEYTDCYSYLGILFQYNCNFVHTKKKLVEQAQKALYAVYYKIRNLNLPIDLQLKIFDSLVAPILLYGSEIWGTGKNDNIEKVHLQFLKRILGVRISTPNFLVYGETGRYPLDINIKCRALCFWSRLMSTEKLSSKIYRLLYNLYIRGQSQIMFVKNIESIFDNAGLSFIFGYQMQVEVKMIKFHIKQILIDQFVQHWRSQISVSSRGYFYSLFKQEFCIEPYLLRLEQKHRIYITKFRLSNFRIPVETGRWYHIDRENRKCTKCSLDVVGDEYHYLFVCNNQEIITLRNRYIPNYYVQNCSIVKMAGMFSLCHTNLLKNVSLFLKGLGKLFA